MNEEDTKFVEQVPPHQDLICTGKTYRRLLGLAGLPFTVPPRHNDAHVLVPQDEVDELLGKIKNTE